MKNASTQFKNQLLNSSSIKTRLQVIAEFNHNRYSKIKTVTGDDWNDAMVPLSSVVEPRRPQRGVLKARLNDKKTGVRVSPDYSDSQSNVRYYLGSEDDTYKYWSSRQETRETAPFLFVTPQTITVEYAATINTNKIVIGFENSEGSPNNFTVEVRSGTTWTNIATNPVLDSDGQVILWYNGVGWAQQQRLDSIAGINGVRLTVRGMNANCYLNVIEISPRLEMDVSDYVKNDLASDMEISRNSFISPVGETSSNTGRIVLSNTDNIFTNENATSPLRGLVQKNVKFTARVGYELGNTYEYLTILTQYVEDWENGEHEVSATLKDSSLYMQNEKTPQVLIKNSTPGAIVWHLLDIMGYSNYRYDVADDDLNNVIPYYWTDPENSLWDSINELMYGTQTVAYFDEFDTLQIKDGKKVYKNIAASWNFTATPGTKLPDIINLDYQKGFEANKVTINYEPIKLSEFPNGRPQMESVWEAEDPTVLRSTRLLNSFHAATSVFFQIPPGDAPIWPFAGVVNIEGEIISYEGKEYVYVDKNGKTVNVYLKSNDEKRHIDVNVTSPNELYRSYFTGKLKITARGLYGTTVDRHDASPGSFAVTRARLNQSGLFSPKATASRSSVGGYASMTSTSTDWRDVNILRNVNKQTLVGSLKRNGRFGTRLRFRTDSKDQSAGVSVLNSAGAGVFIGIMPTVAAETQKRPTVHGFTRAMTGQYSGLVRYANQVIVTNTWYDIDFEYRADGFLSVWVNGRYQGQLKLGWPNDAGDINYFVSVWQRGKTTVDYEYYYGINGGPESIIKSIYDPGFDAYRAGDSYDKNVYYAAFEKSKIAAAIAYQKRDRYFFCDFIPVVQEIRQFEVQFEEPVLYSTLYKSNEHQIVNPLYTANSFGAKFVLANTARVNAVLAGEDTLTYGSDNAVQQKAFIYGRVIGRGEQETVVATNDAAILSDGLIETSFESPWIQTKEYAQKISKWITDQFNGGAVDVNMSVFGNPLVQIGDVVSIFYPLKGFNNEKFIITGMNHRWTNGLETELTLRRIGN